MVDALADVQESLHRVVSSGKEGPAIASLARLKGFIDRGVAGQQATFDRVREYTAHVRTVMDILKVQESKFRTEQEPLFAAEIVELQSFADKQTYATMAKVMNSFQAGLFAGANLTAYPHDNLGLERWFRLPKSHCGLHAKIPMEIFCQDQ